MSVQYLGTSLVTLCQEATQKLDQVEVRARQCLIDWLGVIYGAASEPSVIGRALGDGGTASDILSRRTREPADAAFANAFHAHLLDFDDFHLEVPGHASAAVIGGAFALAEMRQVSLGELLRALVAGVEAVTLLGSAYGDTLFARGWHPTAVFGSVGTAVAATTILGLSSQASQNAVGLAALQSSGSMAGFGSIGKPWQVGAAARNGVQAALAATGLDLSELPDSLAGPHGVFSLMAGEDRTPELAEKPLPRIADSQFKYFASCFGTHAAIRAARRLREQYRLAPGDIISVEIGVGSDFEHVVINPGPSNIYEAKFSVSGTVALTLLGAPPTVPNFFPEALQKHPEYLRLEQCAVAKVDRESVGGGAFVRLELATGARIKHREAESAPRTPIAEAAELGSKFLELTTPELGAERAETMLDWLRNASLEAPITELTRQVR